MTSTKTQARTAARGYGAAHQAERRRWAAVVATGHVMCAREGCGRLIRPGEPWDLGHDDFDRTRYHGPEHQACNRRAGALRGNRSPKRRRAATWRPRLPDVSKLRW